VSYHVIDIAETGCRLTCRDGQLVCAHQNGGEESVPMEDVAAILINAFSCSIHNSVLSAAALARVPLVVCHKFRPVSVTLPVQRATDTLLTRAQITAPQKLIEALWRKTVDAKCANQLALAEAIASRHYLLPSLRAAAGTSTIHKEGVCARHYFDIFSGALALGHFTRNRDGSGLNSLFNYAYAVLLIRTLQILLTTGLDPLYGIGHFVRERATPLAFDLMEPFRVLFDMAVFEWCITEKQKGADLTVDAPFKRHVHNIMTRLVPYCGATVQAADAFAAVLKSFRAAIQEQTPRAYRPWTLRSLKWDGLSFASTCRS
jgi:CRISPR-associated protein Cas1